MSHSHTTTSSGPPLTGTAARWLHIISTHTTVLQPPPDIAAWIDSQRIPIASTHNRQAAAAGKLWHYGEDSDFPVMSAWVFDFLQNPASTVLFSNGQTRTVKNRTAAVIKDAQSGLTSLMLHALAWWITFQGGNVIMITATRDLARDGSKDKLDLLDQYPHLQSSKLPNSTALSLRYPRSIVWLGGGQSSGSVISNPSSLNICDEAAKHTLVNDMIPMKILEGRITADDFGKQISFSSPDNAVEYQHNKNTGKNEPIVTVENAIHASYLEGTREIVEVPCPHCGHYQPLDWQRLRFEHCKEQLPGIEKPIWNRARVVEETWYQCANPHCTDLHPDGTVRGRIDEKLHKRTMIARRRYVATNLEHRSGHRTLQAGGMYNLAFADRSWGAIADKFLTASLDGSEQALKFFLTDVIGQPFSRFQATPGVDPLLTVRRLRRGYRRASYEGQPHLRIPLNTEDIHFIGLTADVQRTPGLAPGEIGAIKWLIFAAAKDQSLYLLDWGTVPSLAHLPGIVETRIFSSRDENQHHLTTDIVCIDTGYAKEKVHTFLASMGASRAIPRWCGIRGRSRENDAALRGRSRLTKEYPATDSLGRPVTLRIINIRADHWETELHIERIAKDAETDPQTGHTLRTAPPVHLPADTPDEVLLEISNAEQFWDKPNKGNVRELKWRKRRPDQPNDHADNLRNGLVLIEAVLEELATGRPQL